MPDRDAVVAISLPDQTGSCFPCFTWDQPLESLVVEVAKVYMPMNTSALITRSLQLAVRPFVLLWAFLKKVALAVFGRLQWSPPHWLTRSRAATSDSSRASPRHGFRDCHHFSVVVRRSLDIALVPTSAHPAQSYGDDCLSADNQA
jgi:hypothetical protein